MDVSRRGFLGGATASAMAMATGCATTGPAPIAKVRFASIGAWRMGQWTCDGLIKAGAQLVALCDIDDEMLEKAKQKWPGLPCYHDYRVMLDEMGDAFDAVQIATPDSTHAYIAIDCMNAGKHVYVQKPLARTFEECEMMREAQRRTGVVVQMGNQGHPGCVRYDALNGANVWGEVKEIESWSDRPVWPQGMTEYAKPEPLPKSISPESWDIWCGPAPDHGFSKAYHNFNWRGWWDYGCGAIGDMAVHNADPAFWVFQLGLPVKVVGDTCGAGPVTVAFPKKSVIKMTFKNGIVFTWYDGGNKPAVRPNMKPGLQLGGNGIIIHGSKATTLGGSHASKPSVIAAGDHPWDKESEKVAAAAQEIINGADEEMYNHYREFVQACKDANPQSCGSQLNYAAPLTEAFLIGCIGLRFPGKELHFDPETKRFTNCEEANRFLKAPNRGAWQFADIREGRSWWSI